MHVLHGTLVQPVSPSVCRLTPRASVTIGDQRRISDVTSDRPALAGAVGGEGCFIIPGFIDAHLHLPQWDRRGIDGLSLSQWQEVVGNQSELRTADPATARSLAEQFVRGLIQHGTTTVAAFSSALAEATDIAFSVMAERGYRAIFGMALNDVDMPDALLQQADAALEQARALAVKWHNAGDGRLLYAFSPRTPIHCSEDLMRGAAALAKMTGCHIQTHVGESLEELSAIRDQFPEFVDEVDLFEDMNMLTSRTILAHGVFLNAQQRRQVAAAGTAIVHCPTANLFRESGMMDFVAHRASGVKLAFGSSVAGGPDPFMPRVAVQALQTAKAIKVHAIPRGSYQAPAPAEAWYSLTKGAAEALGLEHKIGSVDIGYEADLLVVRPEPWIADLPADQQISALLYTLAPQQIEDVFIAGRRVGPG